MRSCETRSVSWDASTSPASLPGTGSSAATRSYIDRSCAKNPSQLREASARTVSVSETLYYRSPVWAQNALVTLYGWTRARKRFGGNYPQIYNEIQETRSLSSAEHSRWLADRL